MHAAILADCFLRSRIIGTMMVEHCRREANKVAQKLVRFAFDSNHLLFWDSIPLALSFWMLFLTRVSKVTGRFLMSRPAA